MEKVSKKKSCKCGESKKRRAVDVEKVRKKKSCSVEKGRKKKSCRCGESKKTEEL